ncbi:unnamed protein product [Paramecium sonneborni]|uniref:Protein kinase domain-containing protein n=1 Tax=Paramecium sonneborni TaxID=65129 RepID=A0A8S1RLK1_9CILI|nr:unnamed protein product [Paramecium sonneborni]
MLEELECNFRTQALLTEQQINGNQKLVVRVIYEQLYQFFQKEKNITGEYLRGPCLKEEDQIYQFLKPKGTTLEYFILQKIILSEEEITSLFNQLILALYEIHKQGVLGRCFSIYNIYYDRIKITLSNFGYYSDLQLKPPEFLKYKTYSLGIDMWLLGCIIYQLSTKEILQNFNSYEEYNQFYKRIDKKKLPKSLVSILLKMLNPQDSNRLRFGELHSIYKCVNENNQIRQYYKSQFHLFKTLNLIREREEFNVEWAIVKEFNGKSSISLVKNFNSMPNNTLIQFEPDPDPNFMLFYNKSELEKVLYPVIWKEMHFHYFRFYIMENTIKCMKMMFQMPFIIWGQFALQTMLIIIKKQFLKEIQQSINIFHVQQAQWDQFLANSKQLKQHLNEINYTLQTDIQQLNKIKIQFQSNQLGLSIFESQLFRELELHRFFQDTSEFDQFEQFRIPYRQCLQFCYYELEQMIEDERESQDLKFFARLRLQMIICMTINKIFNENQQLRTKTFNVLKLQYQLDDISTPNHIAQFLIEASTEFLEAQTDQIHSLFFRSNYSISTIKKE